MEVMSPQTSPFLLDNAAAYTTPKSSATAIMNPFLASTDDVAAAAGIGNGNPFLATATATAAAVTAPPSPNPFGHLPPGADPFDLFHHFTSAPTSPARAAAIFAQLDTTTVINTVHDDEGFQPRVSYSMSKPSTVVSSSSAVPFDWEEKPGKPKAAFAAATLESSPESEFDFGVLLDKAGGAQAQAQELTATADELFDEGKIRPLKPPPRLLEAAPGGGSVGSSPRSARSAVLWSSPRLRGLTLAGSGSARANNPSFDPFAAALAKAAAHAPSPLGVEPASSPPMAMGLDAATSSQVSSSPAATSNGGGGGGGGRKKWRLRDLLLFRRAAKGRTATPAAGGGISRDPVFKYAPPVVQPLATPVKTTATDGDAASAAGSGKHKKQSKKTAAAAEGGGMPSMPPQRQNLMVGCVRLHPGLHRLAKGFHGGHSAAHLGGRGAARSATTT